MDVKQEPVVPLVDEIKQEIIECEEPKLEQRSDLLIKNHDYVLKSEFSKNTQLNIKKEGKVSDLYVSLNNVKQEPCDLVEPKTESEILTLLTTYCDLPTLKDESADHQSYLGQQSNNKQKENVLKSIKNTGARVFKKRRRRCRGRVGQNQNNFRLSRKNLCNVQFGRCYGTCYYCGQFFLNKSQFMSHFIIFHCVQRLTKFCKINFRQYKLPSATFNSNEKQFQCKDNSKTFQTDKNLLNRCDICLKQFTQKYNLNAHLKLHTEETPFKCEICSKQFIRKDYLKSHLKIHTDESLFKCDICSKQFNRKEYLKRHLNIHTKEKLFKCTICSKQFNHKSNFNMHLKIHTGEKPFKCKICSKQFIQKISYEKHLIYHTGEKPFMCEICPKQFVTKAYLNSHLKIHTGENLLNCKICSKQFTHKSSLNIHLKIHSGLKPFKCQICSKQFNHRSNLKTHLIIHNGEKPFKCEICSKQFTHKSYLNRHLKIHSGEKPFKCEICSKQFTHKSNLISHKKIHTTKNSKNLVI